MRSTRTYTGSEIRTAMRVTGTRNVAEAVQYLTYCDEEDAVAHCPVCDGAGHNCYTRDFSLTD